MKTIEEVIRNNWEPQFRPIDECDFSKLAKAIRQHYLDLLPKEVECQCGEESLEMWGCECGADSWNGCIQEMRERIEK